MKKHTTGKKDIDGKEIYEGDIVMLWGSRCGLQSSIYKHFFKEHGIIKFKEGEFVVSMYDAYKDRYESITRDNDSFLQVIGNIYNFPCIDVETEKPERIMNTEKMEEKVEFVRVKSFVEGLMNLIDKKIENCFEMLIQSKDVKYYGFDDGDMKVNSVFVSDNEILNNIVKLEKLRKDYWIELQEFK